jgi:hypothetical protein
MAVDNHCLVRNAGRQVLHELFRYAIRPHVAGDGESDGLAGGAAIARKTASS